MIQLLGRETFNTRLEEGFAKGYVDLSNEPNLQAPFLFNYSGKPWLTQQYSRRVLRDYFELSPYTGWVGEEDEGQMSAYFVLLSMGLFEMAYYPGGTFTIEARGNSATNLYIQSATLNGRPLNEARLFHADVAKGGRLVLQMGPKPNEQWGHAASPQSQP